MIHEKLTGYEAERISRLSFRLMGIGLKLRDILFPVEKRINSFGIETGSILIDYGCGTGNYTRKFSELVGYNGKVYAMDIHELALKCVDKKKLKYNLNNVETVLTKNNSCDLKKNIADVIVAVDMFHMVKDTGSFLKELHRLIKNDGFLIIDPGHQSRTAAREKIIKSKLWELELERKDFFKYTPNL